MKQEPWGILEYVGIIIITSFSMIGNIKSIDLLKKTID